MNSTPRVPILSTFFGLSFLFSISCTIMAQNHDEFVECLNSRNSYSISEITYSPKNSSYTSTFLFSIQNMRFVSPSMPKPSFIFTPSFESQIQAIVLCSKANNFQIRIRSGGHDYEGLSYSSKLPFVIIDLKNLNSITIDPENRFAWVEGGVGGHFSGGGYGTLLRKYGISADNILDARIVNANGEILDRKSMGEDLFWAIRGGGAASFGVVTRWKIGLVKVPDIVTVFTVNKTLDENALALVHCWQFVADKFDRDLFVRILITRSNSSKGKKSTKKWIEAVLYFSDLPFGSVLDDLTKRTPNPRTYYKAKSDYVRDPISENGLLGLWEFFKEDEAKDAQLIFAPYGGRMSEISEYEIPFPHRSGNIYEIQHLVYWDEKGDKDAQTYIDWIRRVYEYITPFVSKNPRAAYLNYRDLDLGVNKEGNNTSYYEEASVWGVKYFKGNFERLVRVKNKVDPSNFFRNEQSIPTILT
ncbi:hypothetical protein ACP275_03G083300 [Erythranthe tilingii]